MKSSNNYAVANSYKKNLSFVDTMSILSDVQ